MQNQSFFCSQIAFFSKKFGITAIKYYICSAKPNRFAFPSAFQQ